MDSATMGRISQEPTSTALNSILIMEIVNVIRGISWIVMAIVTPVPPSATTTVMKVAGSATFPSSTALNSISTKAIARTPPPVEEISVLKERFPIVMEPVFLRNILEMELATTGQA